MKKFMTIFLSIILVFSLSACNEKTEEVEKEVKTKTEKKEDSSEEVHHKDELIKIKVEGGELAGILTTPIKTTNKTMPVVLLVPGSGPVPKNGVANEFGQLSVELAKRGIASLRYDKRGSFDSNGIQIDEEKIKVKDYVDDISQLIFTLQDDKRFSSVFVLGHSQGALFSALSIKEIPVHGFISVAGAGRTVDIILKEQIQENELNPPEVIEESAHILKQLKKGNKVEDVSELVAPLFRPSIQSYLIDWISYDPVKVYEDIAGTPTIIIQGKNDIQIKEKDAKLLADALGETEPIFIDKMSHILKDAATKEDREEHIKIYKNVKAPINEEFINALITFINENKDNPIASPKNNSGEVNPQEGTEVNTGEGTDANTGDGTDANTGEGTDTNTGEGTDANTGEGTDANTEANPDGNTEVDNPENNQEPENAD